MFGLEEYYDGLLLEAKSPEEIKKILEYQFVQGKGVPQEVLDQLMNIDPTRKFSYTRWVLIQWENSRDLVLEALKDGRMKRMFKLFKEKAQEGLDINRMKSLEQALEMLPDVDPCLDKSEGTEEQNDFDIVYDTPEWTIAVPHCYEASEKLGRGMRWCTAGAFGNGPRFYERYSSVGPLWVNFDKREGETGYTDDKPYPYTRYQFLFEWEYWAGEFMDKEDNRVDVTEIDYPEGVVEFYTEQNERYGDILRYGPEKDEETRREEYEDERRSMAVDVLTCASRHRQLLLMPEEDTVNYTTDGYWYLYDSEDLSDESCGDPFDPQDFLIWKIGGHDYPIALLKNTYGELIIVWANIREMGYMTWEINEVSKTFETTGVHVVTTEREGTFFVPTNNVGYGPFRIEDFDEMEEEISDVRISQAINGFISANKEEIPSLKTYDGQFIEVEYKDGFCGLVYIGSDGYEVIIKKDRPANNSFYEPFMKDGQLYAKGMRFEYNLAAQANNYQIEQEIGVVEKLYIVVNRNDEKNLYSERYKKLVFDTPLDNIAFFPTRALDIVICKRDDKFFFYDIENYKIISESLSECQKIAFQNLWLCTPVSGEKFLYRFDGDEPQKINGIKSVACRGMDDDHALIQTVEERYNIMDLNTMQKVFDTDYAIFGTMPFLRNVSCVYFGQSRDDVAIYNYRTKECVLQNPSTNSRPIEIGTFNETFFWRVLLKDDKNWVIMANTRIVLNTNVGEVLQIGGGIKKNGLYVPTISNNTFYCVFSDGQNDELLPSRDGISLDKCSILSLNSESYNFCFQDENGEKIKFFYRPWREGDRLLFDPYTSDTAQKVLQIFMPSRAMVQENFKRIYKSLIDVEKRKKEDV